MSVRNLSTDGVKDEDSFRAGAAAQREADLKLFAQWVQDVELPFGGTLKGRHTFNVDYPEYVSTVPLEKP
jgi:hypothetical protein